MTLMQKRAVLVCVLCVLAVLLTFGITTALLKKGGDAPAPSVSEPAADPAPGEDLSSHYQIDNASAALLTEKDKNYKEYRNAAQHVYLIFIINLSPLRLSGLHSS